jgi:hypothetical protein
MCVMPQVLMNPRDAQGQEITWRNASALDGYVRRLNAVAGQLAQQNRCCNLATCFERRPSIPCQACILCMRMRPHAAG